MPSQSYYSVDIAKGNTNKPLHADYLNNKMKSIRKRHKKLAHATLHKLRHTGTTQIYVNTPNVVPMAVGEFALKSLKQ